jgi:nicotinate-nucleotide adenylyltransferase
VSQQIETRSAQKKRTYADQARNTPPMRICLFGGTFDPIHQAHLQIAEEAQKKLVLDRVLFVPAANPPHKQVSGVTPYKHRARMVELAVESHAGFEASYLEESEDVSYSINTVRRLLPTLPPGTKLFFLIGSDAFDEIETWREWRELVRLVEFIVVSRPGTGHRAIEGARAHELKDVALPVSSTEIRERLARREPTPELPAQVRAYIDEHGLYRNA